MGVGAILGGAAEGTGRGLGRFSNSILQVLGGMEGRKDAEGYRAAQAEERTYRRDRDTVRDTADQEAADLQSRTLDAQSRESDRRFSHQLRESGYDFDYHPERVGVPGGTRSVQIGEVSPLDPAGDMTPSGPAVGNEIARRFTVGDYNPEIDPAHQRRLSEIDATADARTRNAPPPTISVGGKTAPDTPGGRTSIEDHMKWRAGLPGESTGRDPTRDQALFGGARMRMIGEDGKIDWMRLEDMLAELESKPGITNEDLEVVRERFTRQY